MAHVRIFDTTLRDGEQSPAFADVRAEARVCRQLERLNVDIIEAGFRAASPDDFAAVQQIAREIKGRVVTGLARAVLEDIDILWEAVKVAEAPRMHTFLSTSDIHLEKQFRMTREQGKERAVAMVARAKSYCSDVEFSPMDATLGLGLPVRGDRGGHRGGRHHDQHRRHGRVRDAGRVRRADLRRLGQSQNADKAVISVHYDDLGMAVANSLAAIRAARQVEGCINGIGERAGNASLEEVIMALRVRQDFYKGFDTQIDATQACPTSEMLAQPRARGRSRTRRSSGRTRSRTSPAFTRTAC